MTRALGDPRHHALRAILVAARKRAGLRQVDLASKLDRTQDYVSHVETGQKVVGVLELADWAAACGLDPAKVYRQLRRAANGNGKPKRRR